MSANTTFQSLYYFVLYNASKNVTLYGLAGSFPVHSILDTVSTVDTRMLPTDRVYEI